MNSNYQNHSVYKQTNKQYKGLLLDLYKYYMLRKVLGLKNVTRVAVHISHSQCNDSVSFI